MGERVLVFTDGGAGRIPSGPRFGLGEVHGRSANRRRERSVLRRSLAGLLFRDPSGVPVPARTVRGPASGRRWARSSGSCGTRSPAHEDAGQGPRAAAGAAVSSSHWWRRSGSHRSAYPRRRPDTSSSREPGLPGPRTVRPAIWVTDRAGGGLSVDQIVAGNAGRFRYLGGAAGDRPFVLVPGDGPASFPSISSMSRTPSGWRPRSTGAPWAFRRQPWR